MKKIIAAFLVFSSITLTVIALGVGRSGTTRPNPNADAFNQGPDVDNSSAIVQLKGDPISTNPSTKPPHGRKIDFKGQAVRSYRAQLNQKRNEFKNWLRANASRARVTGEYDVSLNAVAVQLNGTPLATITAAPMVQSAEYNALYHPTLSQSHFIISADAAWAAAGGRATAGAGIKIGDIDQRYRRDTSILRSNRVQHIPRDFRSAMRLTALRITRIKTAITFRKKLLLRRFSTISPITKVLTPKASRITGHTLLASRLE